ncbi:MAG TPA: hypothetical protein VHN99_03765 [Deinococcales bacterium]|nr:hypothetical protein [Deinococcales bacterium]
MMAAGVSFYYALVDRVSEVARGMTGALNAMTRAQEAATVGQERLNKAAAMTAAPVARSQALMASGQRAVATAVEGVRNSVTRSRDAVERLKGTVAGVFNLPNAVMGGAVVMGMKSIVDAAAYKEQQLISFGVMLHSNALAAKVYADAVKFADVTPFEPPEVLDATRQFLSFGFTVQQTQSILTRAGNIASGTGKPLQQVVESLNMIKAGRFGEGFQSIATLGISKDALEGQGLKFDNGGAYQGSVADAIGAIVRIADSRFGGMMDKQSRTIQGLWSTLASRPFTLFSNLDDNGALGPLRKVIFNLGDLLNFDKDPGKRIASRFQSTFGALFKGLFGGAAAATSGKAGERFVNRILDSVDRLGRWLTVNGPVIKKNVAEFIGGLKDGFSASWSVVKPVLDLVGKLSGGAAKSGGGGGLARIAGYGLALAGVGKALAFTNDLTGGLASTIGGKLGGALLKVAGTKLTPLAGALGQVGGSALKASFQAVGGFLRMGATAAVTAVRMAAAWLVGLGPIGWAIGAVALVGTAFVLLYTKVAWFRNAVNAVWAWLKTAAVNVWTAITGTAAGIWNKLTGIVQKIVAAFTGLPARFLNLGAQVVQGLVDGLTGAVGKAVGAVKNVADSIVGGFKNLLGIHSPSRIFAGLGAQLPAGVEQGILAGRGKVNKALAALTAGATLTAGVTLAAAGRPAGQGAAQQVEQTIRTRVNASPQAVRSAPLKATAGAARRPGNLTVHMTVNAPASAVKAADLKPMVVDAMLEVLERGAMEVGA